LDSNKVDKVVIDQHVDFRHGSFRAMIPSALVIAVITALSTSLTSRCGSGYEDLERAQRQNHDALERRLSDIERSQKDILYRIDKESTEQKNRDLFQDLAIQGKAQK
jgi:hypothetical protein